MKIKPLEFLIFILSCLVLISVYVFAVQIDTTSLTFNETNPHRGDAILVYAKWNETINSSVIAFNMTNSATTLLRNYTCISGFVCNETYNNTWTNYTITTNTTWSLGKHLVKIYVNSTSESGSSVSNVTEANFTLWSWSEVNESAHASSVTAGSSTKLYCRARDKNTTSVISDYNVTFYDNTTYLGSNLTNSSGWSNISKSWSTVAVYNITCNVTDNSTLYYNASETNSNTSTITVSAAPTTITTSTTPPSGSSGTPVKKVTKKAKTWTKITPGVATIMKIDDPEIGLKIINITVKNPAQTVTITVTKLDKQPATIVHTVSGKVYKYIEIEARNLEDENIDEAKIQFPVNKSWISKNNIDETTIALNRYHDKKWEKLPTQKVDEDDDYNYYEAETPGFTTFAVTGEEKVTTAITTTIPPATTTVPTTIPVIPEIAIEVVEIEPMFIFTIIIVIIIIAVIVSVIKLKKRRKRKKEKKGSIQFFE